MIPVHHRIHQPAEDRHSLHQVGPGLCCDAPWQPQGRPQGQVQVTQSQVRHSGTNSALARLWLRSGYSRNLGRTLRSINVLVHAKSDQIDGLRIM